MKEPKFQKYFVTLAQLAPAWSTFAIFVCFHADKAEEEACFDRPSFDSAFIPNCPRRGQQDE